jgi:hypothetical protein
LLAADRYTWSVPGDLELSGVWRDPKDEKFLACAVEGNAHYLVSSDRDLLELRSFRGVVIHNPGQFLLALELSMLDAEAMLQRFGPPTLARIQQSMLLDPETAGRLAAAISSVSRAENSV